ncbi:hypothetical protein N431DRAFT_391557 [Stipitochalara longipes BDJ]|nr:hypothetical protein N431DRAFT_391557 [Stipitochalara longipes BDJ]
MKACRNRVETIDRRATGIKDNLISLTNMSSTKAILTTTADTSRMKIISILTAVFLPFTVVAVVLTIPMFEWPKADEGEIIVPLPFKIFWETSIPLAALTGLLMWLISEGEKRGWKNLPPFSLWRSQSGNDAPASNSSEMSSKPKTPPSSSHGGVVAASPPRTPPRGPVGKDKTNPTSSRGVMQRLFRKSRSLNGKHTADVESAPVSSNQEHVIEIFPVKRDGPE